MHQRKRVDKSASCSLNLFNVYMDAVMKEVKRDGNKGREWRLLGPLYADGLVLFGKSEEELRAMVGFGIVC